MNSIKDNNTDLNQELIKHPSTSCILRVSGESMKDGFTYDGDLLFVDSAIEPKHMDIVVAAINGEFTVKKLQLHPQLALIPMNSDYKPIYLETLGEEESFIIFGEVTHVIHKC